MIESLFRRRVKPSRKPAIFHTWHNGLMQETPLAQTHGLCIFFYPQNVFLWQKAFWITSLFIYFLSSSLCWLLFFISVEWIPAKKLLKGGKVISSLQFCSGSSLSVGGQGKRPMVKTASSLYMLQWKHRPRQKGRLRVNVNGTRLKREGNE